MKKLKLAIYGSAAGDMSAALPKAAALGTVLAGYADRLILLTGACSGLPYAAIAEAAPAGVEVWGYSPACDLEGQKRDYPEDPAIYDKLIYVPKDFPYATNDRINMKYRNIMSAAACDAAIIISGRWGTLNEFTNVIDFGKPVGVLTGTGGVADALPALTGAVHKERQGALLFDSDPAKLVEEVLASAGSV